MKVFFAAAALAALAAACSSGANPGAASPQQPTVTSPDFRSTTCVVIAVDGERLATPVQTVAIRAGQVVTFRGRGEVNSGITPGPPHTFSWYQAGTLFGRESTATPESTVHQTFSTPGNQSITVEWTVGGVTTVFPFVGSCTVSVTPRNAL